MLNGMVGVPPSHPPEPELHEIREIGTSAPRRKQSELEPDIRFDVTGKKQCRRCQIGANDSNAAIGSSQTVEKLLRKHHKRSAITPAGKAEAAARHFETHVTGRPEVWHRSAQDDVTPEVELGGGEVRDDFRRRCGYYDASGAVIADVGIRKLVHFPI